MIMLGLRQEEIHAVEGREEPVERVVIFTEVRTMAVPMRKSARMTAVEVSLHEQGREEPVERVVIFTEVRTMAVPVGKPTGMTALEDSLHEQGRPHVAVYK